MKFLKLKKNYQWAQKENDSSDRLLNKWEYNFLLTLVVLLVMATIVDLDVSFNEILNLILP